MLNNFEFTNEDLKYDMDVIKKMISGFIAEDFSFSDIDLYLDLDNNLALFSPFGDDEAIVEMFRHGHFRHLQPLDNGTEVVPILQDLGINVYTLSACIERNGDGGASVREEKSEWLDEFFPTIPDENIIFCMSGENKTDYVKSIKNAILVDDYGVNLHDWIEAGGFAVKKTSAGILTGTKRKVRNIPTINNFYELILLFYKLGLFQK